MSSTTTTTTQNITRPLFSQQGRSLRKASSFTSGIASTASTPNLNAIYSAHSRLAPANSLARKASFAALTQSSLASIPDVSESYALNTVLSESSERNMAPATPGKGGEDYVLGDIVDVPGSMYGTVRFIGTVQGKKGTFAGVELHQDFAPRGKNNGDVDGISYFTTTVAGAGIFLPVSKAARRDSPPTSAASSFPLTPTTGPLGGLKVGNQNSTNYTPPTPSVPKFSQSMGPGRAPSPQGKRPRPSLPRPESPIRRLQMTPGPRPSIGTPAKAPSRYGSPTTNRFAQSVRGTAGDPNKKGSKLERKGSIGPRSASAMGNSSGFTDDETTPVGLPRTAKNGSISSVSSFNLKMRPASRANDDEVDRLRSQLDERDRQLRDQAATLAEMESSLAEVQNLMDHPDGFRMRRSSIDDKDALQLRAILREKSERIAMLTAEFDAHRADFRSTIDTLEMASTETERVYEKRIEELMQDIRDLESRTDDVDSVARQLKQLEELVQELEEGLEDARRGEAEARGEVEFLRGEVERTRSELRREREKASAAMNPGGVANGDRTSVSKELEQKEDEIRGLKAIIHSLSRDSIPGSDSPEKISAQRTGSFSKMHKAGGSMDARVREKLEQEVSNLRALVDDKSHREEELERELEVLRRGGAATHRGSAMTIGSAHRSSLRDSRDTVILARNHEPRSPETHHKRARTLDTMPESDAYSTATENSTLWCEICETGGHDILTCTNMFGSEGSKTGAEATKTGKDVVREGLKPLTPTNGYEDIKPAPLSPVKTKTPVGPPTVKILPNPMESGPVAGKDSGVVDDAKWCALCERDGHDSVDCPFEDAF